MALEPVWIALVDASSLSPAQQLVLAELLARHGDPTAAARFFARPDVTAEARAFLIRSTYDHQLIKSVLATPVVTTEMLLIAADKLGAEAVLTEVARTRWDLKEAQLLLVERLDHASARRVADSWGGYVGHELRTALIDAAVRDRPKGRERGVASDAWRKAERDAWIARVEAWHGDIWALLSAESARGIWPELIARGEDHGSTSLIVNLLLSEAKELTDETLSACLKSEFADSAPAAESDTDLRGWEAWLELERIADIVDRHPRALLLHGVVLRPRVAALIAVAVAHSREKGISEWDWSHFEPVAAVCTSPEVLDDVAALVSTAVRPSWQRGEGPDPEWGTGRTKAADALAMNPLLSSAALALIAPLLSPVAAARFVLHPDEQVRKAAEEVVAQAVGKMRGERYDARTSRKEPERPSVPLDDVLAESGDPRAELAAFLPLKGAAAYKRQVAEAIAASRFADADLLRQLPALIVLGSTVQASTVAQLLQSDLGDNADAWEAFVGKAGRLTPNATKSLSTLIDEALDSGPEA
ncbi:hypothetical protein ACICHK_20640 [Streptomyces sp. AHU1]|uniref:hypothetical protein n=1 Tax=Streptomyces sp. AHU1 TaxID=3377215 RepID=UPI003877BF22